MRFATENVSREWRQRRSGLRALATTAAMETAAFGVPGFILKWRAMVDEDENYVFAITL